MCSPPRQCRRTRTIVQATAVATSSVDLGTEGQVPRRDWENLESPDLVLSPRTPKNPTPDLGTFCTRAGGCQPGRFLAYDLCFGSFWGSFWGPGRHFGGSGGGQEVVRRVPGPPPRTHLPLSLGAPPQSGPKTHLGSNLGPTMDLLYSFLLSLPGPPEPPPRVIPN